MAVFKNLAGDPECDVEIERELTRCGIELAYLGERLDNEVASSIIGKLGDFKFTRSWHYWVVEGNVPLAVAEELYADAMGETDVRVAGNCGCPPPGEWATYIDKDGLTLIALSEIPDGDNLIREMINRRSDIRVVDDPSRDGEPVISLYHIDTEIGLRFFADTLKKHGLAGVVD